MRVTFCMVWNVALRFKPHYSQWSVHLNRDDETKQPKQLEDQHIEKTSRGPQKVFFFSPPCFFHLSVFCTSRFLPLLFFLCSPSSLRVAFEWSCLRRLHTRDVSPSHTHTPLQLLSLRASLLPWGDCACHSLQDVGVRWWFIKKKNPQNLSLSHTHTHTHTHTQPIFWGYTQC